MPVVRLLVQIASLNMLIAILTQYGIIKFGSRGLRNGREKKEADSLRHETNTQYKYVSERKNFMKL